MRTPAKFTEINLTAFQEGLQLAQKMKESFKIKEVDSIIEV